jgi:tetratricopeptide (TPR) repeat protein
MLGKKVDAANREFAAIAAKDLTANELNELCWTKALANIALDRALEECNRSLAKEDIPAAHDSKGVVLLRQARYDEAIAEFDLALKAGDFAAALYGRALAYAGKGDRAKSDADAAQAMKLVPGVARTYEFYGLVRSPASAGQ